MREDFIQSLNEELGADVVFGADIPARFRNDWAGLEPVTPLALVRPRTTEQISATLRLCDRFKISVVPQGGLTGLAGGARPIEGGVALSLDRMNGIDEIDPVMATMTVQGDRMASLAYAGTVARTVNTPATAVHR